MDISQLRYDSRGLIPSIAQDIGSGEVLMLAYMNKESLKKSLDTGFAHYWSRSRGKLWMKGETSGNTQKICNISYDCDKDAILLKVIQKGNACHTDNKTCFFNFLYNKVDKDTSNASILYELYDVILDRKQNPVEESYTNYLLNEGLDKILKKVGEESTEVVIAAKNASAEELIYEASDLLYHLLVLLVNEDIAIDSIFRELKNRR
ncbi:MAG: bifunctional phosphoribosyl-AMP cyclohydrolase/phosphoribosyl-ATP diphosphatase HisIE [Clostridiales bacterium]|nr:bifunctional phosphoribosyl-AMP cyclohydrolase/phosphoribosyl-ATP diphosphatase HisIE [Clostridiales bacterium]